MTYLKNAFRHISVSLVTLTLIAASFSAVFFVAEAASTGVTLSSPSVSTAPGLQVNFKVSTITDGPKTDGTYIRVTDNGGGNIYEGTISGQCNSLAPDSDSQFDISNNKGVCYSNDAVGTYTVTVQLLDAKDGNQIGLPASITVNVVAGTGPGGASGAVWTNTGPCGAPQNVNQYEVGQGFYGHGDKFAPNTTYTWVVKEPGAGGPVLESGSVTTDADGSFCELLFAITAKHVGGPYQFTVGDSKNDNFSVIAGLPAVKGCTDENATNHDAFAVVDDGSCLYNLIVKKVVPGVAVADYPSFSFTVDGGATTTFSSVGSNTLVLSSSSHTILEVPVAGYVPSYDNCIDVDVTSGGATCTITNTPLSKAAYGTLVVRKVVEGESEYSFTSFGFTIDGQATTTFDADGQVELMLPVGLHTVVENPVSGYTTTYNNCENVSVVENATTTCVITNTKNFDPVPTCTVNIVSDASNFVVEKGAFAKLLSYMHPAWTAAIAGAAWIWGDDPVVAPVQEETQTFRKQFGFVGTVTEAKLYVASDNSHSVIFNASATGADASENNFQLATQDVYDVTSLVAQGNNELSIAVRNWTGSVNPVDNPAGLLYKLAISGKPTTDVDCSVPFVPPTPEVDTYRIQGYVWHDDNRNTEWDGRLSEEEMQLIEDSLAGWTVNITNGSSTFSTTTDADGYYYFDVPAGTWTITEVVKTGWERTTQESYVVTVPALVATNTLLDSVRNFFLPTAHAALLTPYYGDYNFGNDTIDETVTPTTNGGGSRSSGSRPRPQVLGDMDSPLPTPQVLGEQVSVVPVGAPDTGRGGAAPQSERSTPSHLLLARREDSQV